MASVGPLPIWPRFPIKEGWALPSISSGRVRSTARQTLQSTKIFTQKLALYGNQEKMYADIECLDWDPSSHIQKYPTLYKISQFHSLYSLLFLGRMVQWWHHNHSIKMEEWRSEVLRTPLLATIFLCLAFRHYR